MEFLSFVFDHPKRWLGLGVIILIIGSLIAKTINRILRHKRIMKYGYPPNCDADGCQLEKENEQQTN